MHVQAFLIFCLASFSFAEEATTTASGSSAQQTPTPTLPPNGLPTASSLPELVKQFQPCAVLCYNAAALDSQCDPGQFDCVCGNPGGLVVKFGICVNQACDCHNAEKEGDCPQFDSGGFLQELCSLYEDKPSKSDVHSASSLVEAQISSVSKTATSNPAGTHGPTHLSTDTASASTNAAAPAAAPHLRFDGAVGLAGAAAVVAAAML